MQSVQPAPATARVAAPPSTSPTPRRSPTPAPPGQGHERRKCKKEPIARQARSVPYKRPFITALLVSAFFYLLLIGTAAALFALMVAPNKNAASLLIGFAGFSAFLWFFSFSKRHSCHCPFCKGTPLLDSGATRHEKAVRFFPLNYGTSNVIRSIARQHFRCQFCGTPFDLLKPKDGH
jgi:hypothetical protein